MSGKAKKKFENEKAASNEATSALMPGAGEIG